MTRERLAAVRRILAECDDVEIVDVGGELLDHLAAVGGRLADCHLLLTSFAMAQPSYGVVSELAANLLRAQQAPGFRTPPTVT